MTRAFFDAQLARLGGLKFPPSSGDTHWEALQDMPEPLLTAAVDRAQQDSDEFPSPKMLRMYGEVARSRVLPAPPLEDRSEANSSPVVATLPNGLTIPLTRFWRYVCEACSDLGWRSYVCGEMAITRIIDGNEIKTERQPWMDHRDCGRSVEHKPHDWSEPCPCAPNNYEIQRRRAHHAQTPNRGDAKS